MDMHSQLDQWEEDRLFYEEQVAELTQTLADETQEKLDAQNDLSETRELLESKVDELLTQRRETDVLLMEMENLQGRYQDEQNLHAFELKVLRDKLEARESEVTYLQLF